jgi:hypothetical protein
MADKPIRQPLALKRADFMTDSIAKSFEIETFVDSDSP